MTRKCQSRLRALDGQLMAFVARSRTQSQHWTLRPVSDIIRNMTTRRPTKLSDQLRKIIDECGVTRYRIAQDTGIDESALAKFYNGKRGLSTDALDRLGEYLGLRIEMDE